MPRALLGDVGKFRKYNFCSVRDLMRLVRNKSHHFLDLGDEVRAQLGSDLSGFSRFLQAIFPNLLIHVYNTVVSCTPTCSAACAEARSGPSDSPDSFEGKYLLGLTNERILRMRKESFANFGTRTWFQPSAAWLSPSDNSRPRRPFFSENAL